MIKKFYKLNDNTGKSISGLFRQYGRTDLGWFNNAMRWLIYFTFIFDIAIIILFASVGFKAVDAFGPTSLITGLGFTQAGLALELFLTFCLTVLVFNILKAKLYYKLNN